MGSGTWWGTLAKAKCQCPRPRGAAFLMGGGEALQWDTRGRLCWLVQRQDLPIPIVALIFLCHPPPHLARSSQLGPPMSRTSQSRWGPWGPTLDAVSTSLLPGRTSLVLPVTAAHVSRHRVGRHRLPLMWLVSHHPAILPPLEGSRIHTLTRWDRF